MKFSLTTLICLFSLSIFGQKIMDGIIIDSEINKPVPYVNIGILNKNKGTVSDKNGKFSIEISNDFSNDTIRISSIGYKTQSYIVNILQEKMITNSSIKLYPETVALNEVVVSGKKLKEKIIGNKTKSGMMRGGFRNAALGHELGIRIKLKSIPIFIKEFHTNVTSNTGESMIFRLNFYNLKDGLPDERIFNKNIIFQIEIKEGEFTLDLSEYNIVLNEDFYLTVELVENQKQGEEIFFSASLLGNPIITRQTSQGKWDKLGSVGIGFNLTVKN